MSGGGKMVETVFVGGGGSGGGGGGGGAPPEKPNADVRDLHEFLAEAEALIAQARKHSARGHSAATLAKLKAARQRLLAAIDETYYLAGRAGLTS